MVKKMILKILKLVFAIFVGIVGFVIGGIIEDAIWTAGDLTIETVSDCENLKSGYDETCELNKSVYYTGQGMIRITGFLVPFLSILKISKINN